MTMPPIRTAAPGYVRRVGTIGWVVAFTVIDLTVSYLLFRWMREPFRDSMGWLAPKFEPVGCAVHSASTIITIVVLLLGAAAIDQLG
jgi:hypothetical protein